MALTNKQKRLNKAEHIKRESLVEVDISSIKPNPENPRTISKDKFEKLCKSVREFPEMLKARPIVVNPDLMILGGNMRLKALQAEGYEKAWIYIAGWDESKNDEFIIKDNVGFGEWDWELLGNEWDQEELIEWGLDIVGFPKQEAEEDGYEIPDDIMTDILLGDLFEIGEHRLLCGDSTNSADVEKLLQGKEPYLMVTDPPYGVNYDADWRNHALRSDGSAIGGNWAGDRKQTTVWEIPKPVKSETGHSTQKPVECIYKPIANHDGDVYDPFLGSGTTMVAAHQLNRKCYGMELDPKYCQVIIDRMLALDPTIIINKNGKRL